MTLWNAWLIVALFERTQEVLDWAISTMLHTNWDFKL